METLKKSENSDILRERQNSWPSFLGSQGFYLGSDLGSGISLGLSPGNFLDVERL